MNEQPKVVNFQKSALPKKPKTDADRVTSVRKAWRALKRAIADAEKAGLHVQRDFNLHDDLTIAREWR